jgi:hypothetical protein
MPSHSSPHSQFLSSWIGLEALGWIYWDTWFTGVRFIVGVIALCRASLTHTLHASMSFSKWSGVIESIHIFSALVHYSFTVLDMVVSQFATSHISRGRSRILMHGVPGLKIQ